MTNRAIIERTSATSYWAVHHRLRALGSSWPRPGSFASARETTGRAAGKKLWRLKAWLKDANPGPFCSDGSQMMLEVGRMMIGCNWLMMVMLSSWWLMAITLAVLEVACAPHRVVEDSVQKVTWRNLGCPWPWWYPPTIPQNLGGANAWVLSVVYCWWVTAQNND